MVFKNYEFVFLWFIHEFLCITMKLLNFDHGPMYREKSSAHKPVSLSKAIKCRVMCLRLIFTYCNFFLMVY